METAEYYRQKARECAELAKTAPDDLSRRLLRAMQQDFLEKAELAEQACRSE